MNEASVENLSASVEEAARKREAEFQAVVKAGTNLPELLERLCPDGVEYCAISDLFYLKNGYTPSKREESFWQNGTIPWFRMEDIRENGRVLSDALQKVSRSAVKGKLFPANTLIIATSATIGEHALIEVPFLCNQRFTTLVLKEEYASRISMKFAYYYAFILDQWCVNNVQTSSFPGVDMKRFREFRFPVPPLEVQEEIVRILDLMTELEAELEAELEKRRLQYVHYRDSLLSFKTLTNFERERERERVSK